MKAVILAAGRGTRIRSVHGEKPKCLIEFEGLTILDHQIESLFGSGVRDIAIVVGFQREQIVDHVHKKYPFQRRRFTFIENPVYPHTNNIFSFWLARNWVAGEAFVCLNADVVFDAEILVPALESGAPISMIIDPEWRDETMKVVTSGNRVLRMSKQIPRAEFSGTYIGITTFSADIQPPLFSAIETLLRSGRRNEFFNVAVQQLADEGVEVGFTSTRDLPWAEIDDPSDLAFARRHVFPRLNLWQAAA